MKKYDYLTQVTNDVLEHISYNKIKVTPSNREEVAEKLNDDLWADDSVTGNGSGSYTYNTWEAEENLCHNLDLLAAACKEFGDETQIIDKGAEACDVTIRCYLLGQAIEAALDEVEEADEDEDGEDEE